jgi:hypothetical protein
VSQKEVSDKKCLYGLFLDLVGITSRSGLKGCSWARGRKLSYKKLAEVLVAWEQNRMVLASCSYKK